MLYVRVSKRYNKIKHIYMYGASLISERQVTMDELVERINARCTVTKSDIMAVLAAFQEQAIYALRNAQGVSLGELGTLYIRANTRTMETAADFTINDVLGLLVGFRPRQSFTRKLQKGQEGISFKCAKIQD
ncbi:MAG: HU family DNA-binding protein [Bacteroidaceae bacterium]|nr:HU family DNA-binding protein [Bacteroidaceae bacterium]